MGWPVGHPYPESAKLKISERHGAKLEGQRFGKLIVLHRNPEYVPGSGKGVMWVCLCDCGKQIKTISEYLIRGDTKSCGCLKLKYKNHNGTHGLSHTLLYGVHSSMLGRCLNPTDQNYERYGGRGITVCDEWKESVQSFYDWAITHGYQTGLLLDRENNNGNYEPNNCRWVTYKVSNNNMRRHGGWTQNSSKKYQNKNKGEDEK